MDIKQDNPVTETSYVGGVTLLAPRNKYEVLPGVLRPGTRIITVDGETWIRNFSFNMSDSRCWTHIPQEQILQL